MARLVMLQLQDIAGQCIDIVQTCAFNILGPNQDAKQRPWRESNNMLH